jgi:predicted nuclease with RNAse H fold
MITLGVDLAAEPAGTALATIEWRDDEARLASLVLGATNELIVDVASGVDKVGIDCAFGWPDEFVDFVSRHAAGLPLSSSELTGMAWRRRLAYRETDRFVHESVGKLPLSVSADRLGLTAMRCAVILDDLAKATGPIDRSGGGLVVEVYPAAGLRYWNIASSHSKRTPAGLRELVERLQDAAPWLDLGDSVELLASSHDAFDSVVASLLARCSARGLATRPPEALLPQARREGWIAIPAAGVSELL